MKQTLSKHWHAQAKKPHSLPPIRLQRKLRHTLTDEQLRDFDRPEVYPNLDAVRTPLPAQKLPDSPEGKLLRQYNLCVEHIDEPDFVWPDALVLSSIEGGVQVEKYMRRLRADWLCRVAALARLAKTSPKELVR